MMIDGPTVYAGGTFHNISGAPHPYLVALDAYSGYPIDWDPGVDSDVRAIAEYDNTLYVGGDFHHFTNQLRPYLAVLTQNPTGVDGGASRPAAPAASLRLAAGPNPFRSATTLRFSLATGEKVSLDVFDAAGRLVASPLHDAVLAPGEHAVEMRRSGLANGLYFARVHAGTRSASTKLLVLQ